MSLDELVAALPEHAADLRRSLVSVLGNSAMPDARLWGAALASAVAARDAGVIAAVAAEAGRRMSPEDLAAAKSAAALMAMTNTYYRAKHLIGDDAYRAMPARLSMKATARPGADRLDFEVWALAASAVFGCADCLRVHEAKLLAAGGSRETAHDALRVAAVVHAAAVVLGAERLPPIG